MKNKKIKMRVAKFEISEKALRGFFDFPDTVMIIGAKRSNDTPSKFEFWLQSDEFPETIEAAYPMNVMPEYTYCMAISRKCLKGFKFI